MQATRRRLCISTAANWHAAGRVSELMRGVVPHVDVHVSEIVTASVRDRDTQYKFGGYMRCGVSMSYGKMPPECTCTCRPPVARRYLSGLRV
eukprot:5560815-Prymnesium_polylepis.1